jgi:Xaa-Pro aminopeptidase
MSLKTSNRIDRLRRSLEERHIEAILISQPENRYYLSGFDGSAGILLITRQHNTLATDSRYIEQAEKQAAGFDIFHTTGEIESWLPELFSRLSIKKLAFETDHISFAMHQRLENILKNCKPETSLLPAGGLVEAIRAVKEPQEIELIEKAVAISDAVMDYIAGYIQPGMTELEVAWEVEKCLHQEGSQSIAFDIIVASGPNAAMPHARPSQRKIQPGEPVLIDMGARFQGYVSDLSRTICPGEADDTFKRVYDIVLTAQQAAIDGITDGISGISADSLARRVIEQAGYADQFGHSLGHGIGLEVHEKPNISQSSKDNLAGNMVFTIEPGIYISGWGGVRVEDTVVLENGKIRVLSKAGKMMI